MSTDLSVKTKTYSEKMAEMVSFAKKEKPLLALNDFYTFLTLAKSDRTYLPRPLKTKLFEIFSTDTLSCQERVQRVEAAFRSQFPVKVKEVEKCDWKELQTVNKLAEYCKFSAEDKSYIRPVMVGERRLILIGEHHNTEAAVRTPSAFGGAASAHYFSYFAEGIARDPQHEKAQKATIGAGDSCLQFGLEDSMLHALKVLKKSLSGILVYTLETRKTDLSPSQEEIEQMFVGHVPSQALREYPIHLLFALFQNLAMNSLFQKFWLDASREKGVTTQDEFAYPLYVEIDKVKEKLDCSDLPKTFKWLAKHFEKFSTDHLFDLTQKLLGFAAIKFNDKLDENAQTALKKLIENPLGETVFSDLDKAFYPLRERHFAQVLLDGSLDIPHELARVAVMGRAHLSGVLKALQEIADPKQALAKAESKGDSKGKSS